MRPIVHHSPVTLGGLTRCCGKKMLELPKADRLTPSQSLVTCGAPEHATEKELIAEISRLEAQRDALIGSLEEITSHLRKVSVYADLESIPVVEGVRQLVADHGELESRIEAVLVLPGQEDNPGTDWVDRDEVHRLLRGGKRVPDTIEGIEP